MKKEVFDFYDRTSLKSYNLDLIIRYQLDILGKLDPFTKRHSENVANLCCRICEYLKCKKSFTVHCTIGGYLHDIGKMFIPPEILNKPSSLNEDEWEVLKTHTIKGKNIALSSPLFKDIADEILHHHERWDGMGYPDGLSKETIPLLSRIVSVVDSFDAMISDRPYRKRMSVNEAIEELKRNSGTQFDPRVVSEFIPLVEDKTSKKVKGEINITEKFIVKNKSNKSYSNYVNTSILFSKYIIFLT